jgi:hypothetical protein
MKENISFSVFQKQRCGFTKIIFCLFGTKNVGTKNVSKGEKSFALTESEMNVIAAAPTISLWAPFAKQSELVGGGLYCAAGLC